MLPSLFISHGSPMLALEPGDSGPALARIAAQLPRPHAIVIVSAHWESDELVVSANPQPRTWHDFGGFRPPCTTCSIPPGAIPAWRQKSQNCSTPRICRRASTANAPPITASGYHCP